MAKCDEGYPCEICGEMVDSIRESDLYLRYVIGMLDPETLHTSPERHIVCNLNLAQFIVSDDFPDIQVSGEFSKDLLDQEFVTQRETLVTRGWIRLQELSGISEMSILDYPLEEVQTELKRKANS